MDLKTLTLAFAFAGIATAAHAQVIPSNTAQMAEATSKELMSKRTGELVTCATDLAKDGEIIQVANQNGQKIFSQDGDQITFSISDADPKLEVLIKYYRSDIEDDGLPEKRIEVLINNVSKQTQEDYLSSKLKSFLYITETDGVYNYKQENSNDSYQFEFDAINVECSVE